MKNDNKTLEQSIHYYINHLSPMTEGCRLFSYFRDFTEEECLGVYLRGIPHRNFIWAVAQHQAALISLRVSKDTHENFMKWPMAEYGIIDFGKDDSIVFFPDLKYKG